MRLYGSSWTRREIEARVGRIEQIGGVERYVCAEGPEQGTEMIRVRTGTGLSYFISPTKGLDLSLVEFQGSPISWQSGNGDVHAAHYDASGANWLRTFSGGMLATCGLTQVGSPSEDQGQTLGVHGRIHHTQARHVSIHAEWIGDEYEMRVRGVLEETSLFGDQLRLTRTITSRLGESSIEITDVVENIGFKSSPHMILYHFNFGFPLLSESTSIEWPEADVVERGVGAPFEPISSWAAPDATLDERVFYHSLKSSEGTENRSRVRISSPSFPASGSEGIQVELSWDRTTLPRLVQWRMPGAGAYVLGVEPSNCWVEGRAKERERGTLRELAPGEAVNYSVKLSIK